MPEHVRIGQLRLHVPRMSEASARALGERVAAGIAERLSATAPGRSLGELHIRLRQPAGANTATLHVEIVSAIMRSLR
jgi:hypothetical protein